jgi:hypothetical protein
LRILKRKHRSKRGIALKRVFTAPTITEAHLIMGVLESEGIETILKNEHLSGLAGGVPFMEVWPEVWIVNDEETEHAEAIIADYQQGLT